MERGGYEQLENTWADTTAAAAVKGALYAVTAGSLYRIDPSTGNYEQLDGSWSTVRMAALGDDLFMWESGGSLYRTAAATGEYTQLDGSWPEMGEIGRASCRERVWRYV